MLKKIGRRGATLSLKQELFGKGFCESKQERTSEKEELCIRCLIRKR